MSFESSTEVYNILKTLKSSIQLRKELQDITRQIKFYKQLNKKDYDLIDALEKELQLLQSNNKKHITNQIDYKEINNSLAAASTNISLYTRCSSLKLLPIKENEASISCIQEETELNDFRLFEQFLVIGLKEQGGIISEPYLQDILYSYPHDACINNELLKTVNLLAFHQGLSPMKFKLDESVLSQIYEVLFSLYYRNGNSFTSILPSEIDQNDFGIYEMSNNDKKNIYCCFVNFKELGTSKNGAFQLIVPRCYCILTYFPCFELHFEILYKMLAIKRTSRVNNFQDCSNDNIFYQENKFDIISEEEIGLIESYYEYFAESSFEKKMQISISLQSTENIDYKFPSNYSYLDQLWFCPLLFSLISLEDFYYLLCAILQEKRIVFYSKNPDFLTSCVIGFQTLISPFKWQHPVYPIYLESFHMKLHNSSSYIIGIFDNIPDTIKNQVYILYNIDTHELNKRNSMNNYKNIYYNIDFLNTYEVIENIRNDYKEFLTDICYIPSETQIQAAKNIINELKRFCNWIINEILTYCNTNNVMDFQIYREIIKNHGGKDGQFFSNLLNTDMFMYAYSQ